MLELKKRWRSVEERLRPIAGYASFFCLAALVLVTLSYGVAIQQKWRRAKMCLAENIYHEARGESRDAKYILGMLTIARVTDPDPQWPKTICGAVAQKRQFSWVLDYELATTRDESGQWQEAQQISGDLLENAWSRYVLPRGWQCARWFKRTDGKGVSKASMRNFDAQLFPVGTFGHHSAFEARSGCSFPLPTN
jgi:hypothetical protein